MFKLARVFARLRYMGKGTEHNPSVLDHMPKGGQVGYTTNNPQLAFLRLSEPAERFNFHVKDFSHIDSSVGLEERVMLVGAKNIKFNFDNMYGRSKLGGGDVFNCNTVFTHQFPRNVKEAKQLEQINGGVNMFMHIEFDESADEKWDDKRDDKMLECQSCGKVVRITPEIIDAQTNGSEITVDMEIGERTNCNLTTVICDWQSRGVEKLVPQNTESSENSDSDVQSDLHSYFDERGLLVKFKVDKSMALNKARVELLRHIAVVFKL